MASISSHLDYKPYQTAISKDPRLDRRKWDHKGTIWAVSALDAAFILARTLNLGKKQEGACKFGEFYIRVDFGS